MAKPIYIHAGCHRSGSSSFQLCLAQNRAVLEARGYDLAYPARDGAPGGRLNIKFPDRVSSPERFDFLRGRAAEKLEALSPDPARGLILSEENIPGRIYPILKGVFLAAARKRAGMLAEGFWEPPLHVIFVVRPYVDFLVSIYRLRAQDHPLKPFGEVVPAFMRMRRGWPNVVRDLQAALQPARMTVIDYARRGESRQLLQLLVPDLKDAALIEPQRQLNRSPTDAALLDLQGRYARGDRLTAAEKAAVVDSHAEDRSDMGVARFGEPERVRLERRYASDLDKIGDMPGVELIC